MNMFLQSEKTKTVGIRFPASLLGVFGMALLLGACSGSGGQSGGSQVAENGEPLICEEIEVTGTRFPRRVCRTEGAWAAIRANKRGAVDEFDRQINENEGIRGDASQSPYG